MAPARTAAASGATTLDTRANSPVGKARIGLEQALGRGGPMGMAPSHLGIFKKSRPDEPGPDMRFHMQPPSLPALGQPLRVFTAVTASECHLEPTSRGAAHIAIAIADPAAAPNVTPNGLSVDEDRHVAADSLRVVDTSVMPTITDGNTSSPTLMLAETASRPILAGAWRRGVSRRDASA